MCTQEGFDLIEGVFAKYVRIFFFVIFVMDIANQAQSLKLTNMSAPTIADPRDDMNLDCHFDMGVERLYAVKWYKDDQEFFRYMPYQQPHVKTFHVPGVHMTAHETSCDNNRCKIRLTKLTREHSGGAYRCEVSSEAPTFRLVSETHNITVAALPRESPMITGLQDGYQIGDWLSGDCRSSEADPVPDLEWYVNDMKAASNLVADSTTFQANDGKGLAQRTITIRFRIDRKYTQGNTIRIACVAKIPGLPVPPQIVSQIVLIRGAQTPGQINNEKLFHWPDLNSNGNKLKQIKRVLIGVISMYFLIC